jgi:hypothetical protein
MLRLRRRRELDPLDKLFHRCRQDHDLGLQFHLTEVVELQKKLLVRGEDACPAEGYEELFYRVEVHNAVGEAGHRFDEGVVGAGGDGDAEVVGGCLGPGGDGGGGALGDGADFFVGEGGWSELGWGACGVAP